MLPFGPRVSEPSGFPFGLSQSKPSRVRRAHVSRLPFGPSLSKPRASPFGLCPSKPLSGRAEPVEALLPATGWTAPEGSALPGRIGAGEQRSGARGSPARMRRTGEKALCEGASSDRAESSQPPSRSEQRSAPEAWPRAAPLSPGRALPSGPQRASPASKGFDTLSSTGSRECARRARKGFDKLSPNGLARGASTGSARTAWCAHGPRPRLARKERGMSTPAPSSPTSITAPPEPRSP
jgi:hypothetical protein